MSSATCTALLDDDRFGELLVEYLDDAISDEDGIALDAALRGSRQRQRQFTHICLLGRAIAESRDETLMNLLAAELADAHVEQPPQETWREQAWEWFIQPMTLGMLVSGIVMTIILLSLALWTVPAWRPAGMDGGRPANVARISTTHQAAWDNTSDANFKNIDLFAGERLVLNSGLAEVAFADGAVVLLEGPADFRLESAGAGRLQIGRLFAKVPPQATGFVVNTPTAMLTDLGTEFGAVVNRAGGTVLDVVQGKVACETIGNAENEPSRRVLSAGEAVRVEGAAIVDIMPTSAAAERFVRDMPTKLESDWTDIQPLLNYRPQFAGKLRSDRQYTIGSLVEVGNQPLEVTHLGVQDIPTPVAEDDPRARLTSDGFHQSPVLVGLWNADGSQLLASARVGNSDRLVVNSYRYVRLDTPVTLEAGQRYLLGAFVGSGIESFQDGHDAPKKEQPFAAGNVITIIGNRYSHGEFAAPIDDGGLAKGRWGAANALVKVAQSNESTPGGVAPQEAGVGN